MPSTPDGAPSEEAVYVVCHDKAGPLVFADGGQAEAYAVMAREGWDAEPTHVISEEEGRGVIASLLENWNEDVPAVVRDALAGGAG